MSVNFITRGVSGDVLSLHPTVCVLEIVQQQPQWVHKAGEIMDGLRQCNILSNCVCVCERDYSHAWS